MDLKATRNTCQQGRQSGHGQAKPLRTPRSVYCHCVSTPDYSSCRLMDSWPDSSDYCSTGGRLANCLTVRRQDRCRHATDNRSDDLTHKNSVSTASSSNNSRCCTVGPSINSYKFSLKKRINKYFIHLGDGKEVLLFQEKCLEVEWSLLNWSKVSPTL